MVGSWQRRSARPDLPGSLKLPGRFGQTDPGLPPHFGELLVALAPPKIRIICIDQDESEIKKTAFP